MQNVLAHCALNNMLVSFAYIYKTYQRIIQDAGKFCILYTKLISVLNNMLVNFVYIYAKLTSILFKTLVSFTCMCKMQNLPMFFNNMVVTFWKKKWIKVIMIMWDIISKHFCRFAHFFCMCRVLGRKKCVPLSLLYCKNYSYLICFVIP